MIGFTESHDRAAYMLLPFSHWAIIQDPLVTHFAGWLKRCDLVKIRGLEMKNYQRAKGRRLRGLALMITSNQGIVGVWYVVSHSFPMSFRFICFFPR
jgi:hypothetical protein